MLPFIPSEKKMAGPNEPNRKVRAHSDHANQKSKARKASNPAKHASHQASVGRISTADRAGSPPIIHLTERDPRIKVHIGNIEVEIRRFNDRQIELKVKAPKILASRMNEESGRWSVVESSIHEYTFSSIGNRSSSQPGPFPFMRLPPELRNLIYELTLRRPIRHCPITTVDVSSDEELYKAICPATEYTGFFTADPSLQREALPFVLDNAIFSFADLDELGKFLDIVGTRGRRFIYGLQFRWASNPFVSSLDDDDVVHLFRTIVEDCEALKHIRLEYSRRDMIERHPDGLSRGMPFQHPCVVPGVRELLQIRGLTHAEVKPCSKSKSDQEFAKWLEDTWRLPKEGSSKK